MTLRKGKRTKFQIGRMTHNEKGDVGTGGNNGRERPLVGRAEKGVGFSREHPRCKGWSARGRSSVDVACVLRKRGRETEGAQESLRRGQATIPEKKRTEGDERGREGGMGAERKREIIKKKRRRVHACARSAFTARVHLSYETSLELVSPQVFSKAC